MARGIPRRLRGRRGLRHARPRVSGAARHARGGTRPRPSDVVGGRLPHVPRKKDAWLANEALADEKFDKKMAQEEVWLRRGVKARRTRDEGRVKALMAMREERAARRAQIGNVRMQVDVAERSGHIVFEAEDVSKGYGGVPVVRDFSTRILRRDRIGLIGP